MTAGIYTITNQTNGRIYVGKSTNAELRIHNHLKALEYHNHIIAELQEDFDEGHVFNYTIVEVIDDPVRLNERESYWIRLCDDGSGKIYNLRIAAGGVTSSYVARMAAMDKAESAPIEFKSLNWSGLAGEIVNRRQQLKMSQQQLAEESGVSRNYISMIERGEVENISVEILVKLAKASNVDPVYWLEVLLGEED